MKKIIMLSLIFACTIYLNAFAAPGPPTDLTATVISRSRIDIAWKDQYNDQNGFKIGRSLYKNGPFAQVTSVDKDTTSYSDCNLTDSTTYYYRVTAYNSQGESGYTNTPSATTWPFAEKVAVKALIKLGNPGANTSSIIDPWKITSAQAKDLKAGLGYVYNKPFLVYNGNAQLINGNTRVEQVDYNDIVVFNLYQNNANVGTTPVINLRPLNQTFRVNESTASWSEIVYNYLDDLALRRPGENFGEDAAVIATIKAKIASKVGSFDNNFDFFGQGTYIEITPKKACSLKEDDRVGLMFDNNPLVYDKARIKEKLALVRNDILTTSADIFFVVQSYFIEPVSIASMKRIVASRISTVGTMSVGANSASSSSNIAANDNCYNSQTGSVLPCNKKIDLFIGDLYFSVKRAPIAGYKLYDNDILMAFMKLDNNLGYETKIYRYSDFAQDGVDFFKAIVNSKAAIIGTYFHGSSDGFTAYIGFAPKSQRNAVNRKLWGLKEYFTDFSGDYYSFSGQFVRWERISNTPENELFSWSVKSSAIKPKYKKAIHFVYQCYGELQVLEDSLNFFAVSKDSWSYNDKKLHDTRLILDYLSGIGPGFDFYRTYKPKLSYKHNVNVSDIQECVNQEECMASRGILVIDGKNYQFSEKLKNVQGVDGNTVQIPVPIELQRHTITDAHLFPYIQALSLPIDAGGNNMALEFSDNILKPPAVSLKINGKSVLSGGANPKISSETPSVARISDKNFKFTLIPEITVLTKFEYDEILKNGLSAVSIPKGLLTIKGATAKANEIEMVGNALAKNTKNDPAYRTEFFPYSDFFDNYNARVDGSENSKTFQANVPYKIYPFVEAVTADGGRAVTISFSMGAEDLPVSTPALADASKLVTVDCTACGKTVFVKGYEPKLQNGRAIHFVLNGASLEDGGDGLYLYSGDTLPDNWDGKYVRVTVKGGTGGVLSPWNKFPLLGNVNSKTKWIQDMDKNGISDWEEGNSDHFPQKEGNFELWIPCVAQPLSPVAPALMAASVGPRYSINLSWQNKAKDVTNFIIYRKEAGKDLSYIEIGRRTGVNSTGYVDVTAQAGKTYSYVIKAYNSKLQGKSAYSKDSNFKAVSIKLVTYSLKLSLNTGLKVARSPDKATYNDGESVTLTVMPAADYRFVNWGGDIAGSGNIQNQTITITMNANKKITALSAIKTYGLKIIPVSGGTVNVGPNKSVFNAGTNVTITAKPAKGYVFGGWIKDNDPAGVVNRANPLRLKISETCVMRPIFTLASSTKGK